VTSALTSTFQELGKPKLQLKLQFAPRSEHAPSLLGSKHVPLEVIVYINVSLVQAHFVDLYYMIILQCTVQKA